MTATDTPSGEDARLPHGQRGEKNTKEISESQAAQEAGPSPSEPAEPAAYLVGYKKPPVHTQFRKGESGNHSGRKTGSKNAATHLFEQLLVKVPITFNGKRQKISKLQAGAIQIANKFALGDPKAVAVVMNLAFKNAGEIASNLGAAPLASLSPEAEAALAQHLAFLKKMSGGSDAD